MFKYCFKLRYFWCSDTFYLSNNRNVLFFAYSFHGASLFLSFLIYSSIFLDIRVIKVEICDYSNVNLKREISHDRFRYPVSCGKVKEQSVLKIIRANDFGITAGLSAIRRADRTCRFSPGGQKTVCFFRVIFSFPEGKYYFAWEFLRAPIFVTSLARTHARLRFSLRCLVFPRGET